MQYQGLIITYPFDAVDKPSLRFLRTIKRAFRASEASCSDMAGKRSDVCLVSMTGNLDVFEFRAFATREMLPGWRHACLKVLLRCQPVRWSISRHLSSTAICLAVAPKSLRMEEFPCEVIRYDDDAPVYV